MVRMHDMRSGNCALCGHDEIIKAQARDFYGELGERHEPMAVTEAKQASFWSGNATNRPAPDQRIGELAQYVCRSCGYVQWFASEPQRIPIGTTHRTSLVKGTKQGPYR
jgi:hypothetical protein